MSATDVSSNEYLAFEHPFSATLLVLFGILCAGLLIWSLSRERLVLGSRTTALFILLRVVAMTTVFWMLLSPTNVLEKETTTRKAVVIVTDTSASMTTVDPAGSADDLRWASFQSGSKDSPELNDSIRYADWAFSALGIANRELQGAVDDLQRHGAMSLVSEHLETAANAIARSRSHLDELRSHSASIEQTDTDVRPMLNRLTGLLDSPEFDAFAELAGSMARGRAPTEAQWRDGLPDLVGRVATSRRVFREVSERLGTLATDLEKQSPSIPKAFTGQPRSERVASFLRNLDASQAASIRETADIRFVSFDSAAREFGDGAEAESFLTLMSDREDLATQTDLGAALKQIDQIRTEQPVATAIVLTDVAHNDLENREPAEDAKRLNGTPVNFVPIGNVSRLRDVDLVSVSAPSVAMRNDDVVIEAHMEVYQCLGETCTVQLLRGGEVIDFRSVLIESDAETRSVQFHQRVSDIGTASFQVAVQPVGGEMTTENNFDEIEINVTRNDIKVLLADELPRWEYFYLAQLFRRDPKVELDELLFRPRMIATGRRSESQGFPVTVDDWDQYDVVILGDLPVDRFPVASQESLVQYMRTRGGTVIMIAGVAAMPQAYVDYPIAEVLPVRPIEQNVAATFDQFAFQITDSGRSHAALMIGETQQATREAWDFVNRFSPLHYVSNWRSPLPTAQSLIAAIPRNVGADIVADSLSQSSFLCWQPVGRGRVVYLSGPDSYRLRFLRGDTLHYRFWGQLMRWAIASDMASGNQLIRIRTAKTLYETDQTVQVDVELLDDAGNPIADVSDSPDALRLRLNAGDSAQTVPLLADPDRPGHYTASIQGLTPGVYQAKPEGSYVESVLATEGLGETNLGDEIVATFTVQADLPTELADTRCNLVLAGHVAELTGGQVLPPTAVSEILALTDLEPVITHSVQREPLWLRWKYLWVVFGCLLGEWTIRKWRGLS